MKPFQRRILLLFVSLLLAGPAVAQTRVLFIAAAGGKGAGPFTTTIRPPLTTAGYAVRTWDHLTMGKPPLDTLRAYDAVFYHGSERSTHRGMDSVMTAYAQLGGRLVVEGTNIADWGSVYPDFTRRALHARWMRVVMPASRPYTVIDSTHMLTAGLPASFASTGYNTRYPHDAVESWHGGHRVLGYGTGPAGATAVTVYPRSVFFSGSLYRITTAAYRDSLIVRSIRWVTANPVDVAVYSLDYELGHDPGQSIPVPVSLMNWSLLSAAAGRLILEVSTDSVAWTPVDSTDYTIEQLTSRSDTLHWTPPVPDLYYLRAVIRPQGTDELAANNSLGLRITTLQAPTHPHLFFTSADIPDLRQRAATSRADFEADLRVWCDSFMNYQFVPPAQWQSANITAMGTIAANAAFEYTLNPNPIYLNLAKRMAFGLCAYPSWSTGFYDQDIYPARACFYLGLVYDWLYNDLTQAERDTIQLKLRTQIERMEASFPQRIWWTNDYIHNHHWHAMDMMGAATFALREEEPDAARWEQCALTSLDNRMALYGPVEDGSWHESMSYWGLISWAMLPHLYLLREELGIDYFNTPFVRTLPVYRIHGALPDFDQIPMVNEAQAGEWYGPDDMLGLLARIHRDGEAQWMRARIHELAGYSLDTPLDFIFWDPTVPETPPTALAKLIPDQDTYFARSSWTSSASYFSLKCGLIGGRNAYTTYWTGHPAISDFAPGHYHPDQGAFTIYYNGKYLVQSEGTSFPLHHTRKSTTILINGQGQIGDSTHGTWPLPASPLTMNPHLEEPNSTPRTEYVIADATTAYPASAGLQQFQRHFLYVRPSTFVIVDRLRTNNPSTFTFCMANRSDVWSWDTSRVLITSGTVKMTARVLQPQPWTVEKSYSNYYYSEWGGWSCRVSNATADTVGRFFTVFHPVVNAEEARVEQLACDATFSAMRLRGAQGLETTALIRYAPVAACTVDSLSTDAELAVVMRDSLAGRITGVTVKDSRWLRWGEGYPLLYQAEERSNIEWDYNGTTLALSGTAREGMRFWAPGVTHVTLQSFPLVFSRDGDYIVLGTVLITPSAITNLTLAATLGGDSVTLRWRGVHTDVTGNPLTVGGYRVYQQRGWNGIEELIATVGATDTTLTLPVDASLPASSLLFSVISFTASSGERSAPAVQKTPWKRPVPTAKPTPVIRSRPKVPDAGTGRAN